MKKMTTFSDIQDLSLELSLRSDLFYDRLHSYFIHQSFHVHHLQFIEQRKKSSREKATSWKEIYRHQLF